MKQKIGVVDVGGGYRGAYAAGVLDYCLEHKIYFDLGIGVSAGSANLISYAAGQNRRNHKFYTEYGLRKEYAGIRNFLLKKSFVDLDYIYSTLSNSDGEYPLDYPAVVKNPMEFIAVATEAETGDVKYFTKSDVSQDNYNIMKASSSIPFVGPPYPVNEKLYYDGALADPVPIEKAFQMGCDKVVLILTMPEDTIRSSERDRKLAARIKKKYPQAAKKLELRAQKYNDSVAYAKRYAAQGKVLIVAPDDTCGVNTLSRDKDALLRLYDKGYLDGQKIPPFYETLQ
ncbi:MAG: patatin family protein [Clostridiales bacterium]|nr:patatin family protein [Clostridiales bacterium]